VQPDITNWLGPGGHVVHYYVRRGALVNVVAVHESETWTEESWVLRGKREELIQAYAGWNEALLHLFDHAHECFKWGLFDRDPLARWSHGRATLMGDAAHPMLPFLGQGAAMAIEDGVALGIILAAHQSRDVRDLLKAYETLRLERTARAQIGSRLRA
jgi:salicylate hydroxylase